MLLSTYRVLPKPVAPTVLFHLSRLWRYANVYWIYFLLPTCLAYGARSALLRFFCSVHRFICSSVHLFICSAP